MVKEEKKKIIWVSDPWNKGLNLVTMAKLQDRNLNTTKR